VPSEKPIHIHLNFIVQLQPHKTRPAHKMLRELLSWFGFSTLLPFSNFNIYSLYTANPKSHMAISHWIK